MNICQVGYPGGGIIINPAHTEGIAPYVIAWAELTENPHPSSQLRICLEEGRKTHCRGSAAMGNSQDKPPGSGGGLAGRPDQRAAGGKARNGKPQSRSPLEKGLVNGTENSQTVDTSYLDAPAGALPPHLARLKNEGNHLFRHGQFADALEKYSRAIEGFPEAGGRFDFFSA